MWDLLKIRAAQGTRTISFPPSPAEAGLPERFRGRPVLDGSKCGEGCKACVDSCPVGAIALRRAEGAAPAKGDLVLDLGKCVFCVECTRACPEGSIRFTTDYRLAASSRDDLLVSGDEVHLARALDERMRRLFGRSLKLRQVSAGGCNGCEAELVASGNIIFDLGRFGIQFVASPRHADGIVVTGPVSDNMRLALEETYRSVPAPRIVVAVGACAIAGGPFFDSEIVAKGAGAVVPVDLYIPGCPPHPLTILDGMLRMLGKLEEQGRAPVASPPDSRAVASKK